MTRAGAENTGPYLLLNVRVVPNASKSCLKEMAGGILKVKVKAPPEKGRANDELVKVLSGALKLPKKSVTVVKGEKSRNKTVSVRGADIKKIQEALDERP